MEARDYYRMLYKRECDWDANNKNKRLIFGRKKGNSKNENLSAADNKTTQIIKKNKNIFLKLIINVLSLIVAFPVSYILLNLAGATLRIITDDFNLIVKSIIVVVDILLFLFIYGSLKNQLSKSHKEESLAKIELQ